MAREDDRAEWKVAPWAGTIDQLRRAARQCETKVANMAPYPPGYDGEEIRGYNSEKHAQWLAARAARTVEIQVREEDGFSRKLTAIDDLDDFGTDQLQRIEGIDISIGGHRYQSPSAALTVSTDRGLQVTLSGPDRTWTAGLRHELEETLVPAGKLRPLPFGEEPYFFIAPVLFFSLGVGMDAYLEAQSNWSVGVRSSVSVGIAAFATLVVIMVGWKLPTLELLPPGSKPTYERWRSRILAALGAVALSIAASLISVQLD